MATKILPVSDDLDFGIDEDILSKEYVQLNDNFFDITKKNDIIDDKMVLEKDKMINPFFSDLKSSPLKNIQRIDNYKRCLVICKKNGIKELNFYEINFLFEKVIDKQKYKDLSNYFTLVEGSIKLLKNKSHFKKGLLIDRHLLTDFNHRNFDLENDEIVIPIFELSEDDFLINYNTLYEGFYNLEDAIKIKTFYDYFNCDSYNFQPKKRLNEIFKSIKETEYWTNDYNCKMNMTDVFKSRTFQYKGSDKYSKAQVVSSSKEYKDKNAKEIIEGMISMGKTDYNFQNIITKKENFIDASSSIVDKKTKFKLYRINSQEIPFTKEQVSSWFKLTNNEKDLFDLFNTFLLSKQYCHLVLNNKEVLIKMENIIDKYMPLYRYLFGYAWLCFYMEECITKTWSTKDSRFVFDIDTANKLPIFPFCQEDPFLNPYFTLLVDNNLVDLTNNCIGLPMIKNYEGHGIDTLENFRKKFNVFTTGKEDKNIFNGLETKEGSNEWKYFGIGGSSITACIEKRSPLLDIVSNKNNTFVQQWTRYFEEYHSESDIDVMCNATSMMDFIDQFSKLKEVVTNNLNEINGKDVSDTIEVDNIKSLTIVVNSKYIDECMKEYDPEYIIKNFDTNEIKEIFYQKYVNAKIEMNKILRTKISDKKDISLYEKFLKLCSQDEMNIQLTTYEITKEDVVENDCQHYVYMNDIRSNGNKVNQKDNILLLKISESIRYKIKSTYIPHALEVFRTNYNDFFSCVARFHLPCVRSYYNGDNVYLLPSSIIALMTHVNIDYKYFAGIRDPIDIINKYRIRGFGTVINTNEKTHMVKYNSDHEKWKKIFGIDIKDINTVNSHFSSKNLDSNIYKPGKFFKDVSSDSYNQNNINYSYLNNKKDLFDYYKEEYNYDKSESMIDLFKFKSINKDGSIEPLKKWIIDASYEMLSKNK